MTGHTGPISCLEFSPIENILFSGSWDKTLRVHDIFTKQLASDILDHNSEITALSVKYNGLKYFLFIFNCKMASILQLLLLKVRSIFGTIKMHK